MSAGAPSASEPPGTRRIRAGFTDSSSTSRDSEMTPACTSRSKHSDTAVSRPVMPNGARSNSTLLLVVVVRRVVGRDDVDAAVGEAGEHRVAIGRLAQRRVHLDVGVVGDRRRQHLVGQHEMMRRHLAGHARAARLAVAHGVERLPRAHVRDVHDAAGQLGERDVAQRHDRFGLAGNPAQPERRRVKAFVRDAVALERLLLAVLDDRHVEHARVLERAPHQHRRRHRMPVVGQRDAAGLLQLGDVGELLALLPARHRADRVDARQVRFGRLLQDVVGDAGVVVDRDWCSACTRPP